MADPLPLLPHDPRRIGSYDLVGRLGEGGQGVVFVGRSPTGQQVAVKLLRAQIAGDARARERFVRELAVAERVAGFCTARVLDAETQGDQPYIVSEFVPGPSLQEFLNDAGVQRGDDLIRLAIGTVTALAAIHEAGIVHRDFKPPNVLMGPTGPRVIDFGIARALDTSASMTSQVVGTPAYMAPEQIAAQPVGPYTDMFAWGVTILAAATGTSPFMADSIPAVMHKVLYEDVDVRALPQPLAGLVNACLSKDPARRPTAAQTLLTLLSAVGAAPGQIPGGNALSQGATIAATQTLPVTQPPGQPVNTAPPWIPQPPAPQPVSRAGWAVIPTIVVAALALGIGDNSAIGLAAIQHSLGMSISTLRWIPEGYAVAVIALVLPASRVADRYGRKMVFIVGAVGFAAFSVLTAMSSNVQMLLGAHVMQGLAEGVLAGASLALLRAAFPAGNLGVPVGVWVGTTTLGAGAGQLADYEFTQHASWRIGFFVTAVPALVAVLLCALTVRESRGDRSFPPIELVLVGSLALLTFGLEEGLDSWSRVSTIASLVVGVALFAVYAGVARPRLGGLLSTPSTATATALILLASIASIAMFIGASLALTQAHHHSDQGFYLTVVTSGAVGLLVASLSGMLLSRVRPAPLVALGSLLIAGALAGLAFGNGNLLVAHVLMAVAGAGFALVLVAAATALADGAPDSRAGLLGGLYQSVSAFGATLGIAISIEITNEMTPNSVTSASFMRAYDHESKAVLLVGAGVALVMAALALLVRPVIARSRQDRQAAYPVPLAHPPGR